MSVDIEVPVPWLESARDGARNKDMFEALRRTVLQRGYTCFWEDIEFRTEARRRQARAGGFRLSYHSYGDARHVWRIKETPIPYFYSFDRLGFSGWSEIAMFPEKHEMLIRESEASNASVFCHELSAWLLSNNLSKYEQPADDADLPPRFVFFPLQVRSDVVAGFCRLDPLLVLREAAKQARRTKTPLVVKRHPYCSSRLTRAAIEIARVGNPYVLVRNASVPHLVDRCSSVIVANSGVGMEALAHRKPVYSFANSEYALATHSINEIGDIRHAFASDHKRPPVSPEKFVHFYLMNMCFDARDASTIDRAIALAERAAERDSWCEKSRFSLELTTT